MAKKQENEFKRKITQKQQEDIRKFYNDFANLL